MAVKSKIKLAILVSIIFLAVIIIVFLWCFSLKKAIPFLNCPQIPEEQRLTLKAWLPSFYLHEIVATTTKKKILAETVTIPDFIFILYPLERIKIFSTISSESFPQIKDVIMIPFNPHWYETQIFSVAVKNSPGVKGQKVEASVYLDNNQPPMNIPFEVVSKTDDTERWEGRWDVKGEPKPGLYPIVIRAEDSEGKVGELIAVIEIQYAYTLPEK